MDIRPKALDDLPACVAVLRRVHETDGYPADWPADPAGWLNSAKLVDARNAEIRVAGAERHGSRVARGELSPAWRLGTDSRATKHIRSQHL
ncbi:hypothetical protein AB0M34_14600 [Nocardia sp. NPDC050193]